MGLWLIASGTSPVTPRAQKPLQVLTKALRCSAEKLLLRGIFPCSAEHFSRIKQPEQRNTSEGEKKKKKEREKGKHLSLAMAQTVESPDRQSGGERALGFPELS